MARGRFPWRPRVLRLPCGKKQKEGKSWSINVSCSLRARVRLTGLMFGASRCKDKAADSDVNSPATPQQIEQGNVSFTEQGGEANKGALLTTRLPPQPVQTTFTLWLQALCRLVNLLEYFMILPVKKTAVCIDTQHSARQALNTSIWPALTFKGLFTQVLQFACSAN